MSKISGKQPKHDFGEHAKDLNYSKTKEVIFLKDSDIKHKIVCFNINKSYKPGLSDLGLYNATRGNWHIDINKANKVDYVFAIYKYVIVGIYKPDKWYQCENAPNNVLPPKELNYKIEHRACFTSDYQNSNIPSEVVDRYLNKSIQNLSRGQSVFRCPVRYL